VADVVTAAKRDLQVGETLDGLGRFTAYGLLENASTARAERLLPLGLAEGCCLKRAIPRDQVITYDDVELPHGRLADTLRAEQDEWQVASSV
jgi:predicted homoserine dehydrogenase-like protein